jgi:hypothetical protein
MIHYGPSQDNEEGVMEHKKQESDLNINDYKPAQ